MTPRLPGGADAASALSSVSARAERAGPCWSSTLSMSQSTALPATFWMVATQYRPGTTDGMEAMLRKTSVFLRCT